MLTEPHYYSSDKIFANKFQALKSNEPFMFNYHDEVWSDCDWVTEPPESIDYYYREQAQRIRDEYDYVILCYSGGYDSTNILETFYYNNIKLDKIVIQGSFNQDKYNNDDTNHSGELYLNAFPYIKDLGLDSIVQLVDFSKDYGSPEKLSLYNYGQNWIEEIGLRFSPHNWFWRDLHQYVVPDSMSDKKVAIIFGRDKPHLMYQNGKPGFWFRDIPVCDYGNMNEKVNGIDRISFYWDPNYTKILIKQVHMLHRAYPERFTDYRPIPEDGLPHKQLYNSDKIVYNLRRPLIYKSPKTKTLILAKRDSFLENHKNTKIYDLYNLGVEQINKIGLDVLSKPIRSKFYGITK
jgi:hypothetical protein